jgi:3-phenylpropionate/trans-cinnamate dioxygenase ferredoxin subunit
MSESTFICVAHISDLRKGGVLEINLGSRNILLCRTREGWFAVDNICTHAYSKLSEGRLRKTKLICPLHGGSFDCRTGAAVAAPAVVPLKTYAVRVIGEEVQIALE